MGLLDKIKAEAAKSGQNKSKFVYMKEGDKKRYRFLNDMEDGIEVTFHDSFEAGINVPCQELFGRQCEYCEEEGLRTRSLYIWSVWDYEAKEVKLFMFAVNNCSPVPALMALYETYGTLLDRDFVVSKTGKQQNTAYSVVPMDKNKFRNEKAKAISEKGVLKYLDKAFPDENADNSDDEDEDEKPVKKGSKAKPVAAKKKSANKHVEQDDDEDDEDDDWDDDEDEEVDYTEMTAKELYSLCKERDLEVLPKKPEKYYIKQLQDYDKSQDDWNDEDDDEEWDDE